MNSTEWLSAIIYWRQLGAPESGGWLPQKPVAAGAIGGSSQVWESDILIISHIYIGRLIKSLLGCTINDDRIDLYWILLTFVVSADGDYPNFQSRAKK